MKQLLYLTLVLLSVTVVYLTAQLAAHPYDGYDVRHAYEVGCHFGERPRPKNDPAVSCETASKTFIDTLGILEDK